MFSQLADPTLLVVTVLVSWSLLNVLIARLTGWGALAERFACKQRPRGEWFRYATVAFSRWSGYNGCVTVCIGETGLYLMVLFPFRPGHPPLLIPWQEILHVGEHKSKLFSAARVSLKEFQQDLYFKGRLGEAVLDYAHAKGFSDHP